jgi:hypothetical protein
MKKEIPQGVFIGIAAVLGMGLLVALAMFFFGGGPGNMSSEEVQRAEMQAEAGNTRMQEYIGNAQGGPPMSGEAAARQQHSGGGQ